MKDVIEILNSICGVDEDGESKCMIGFNLLSINEKGEEIKKFDTESVYKPVVQIFPNTSLVQMDIQYNNEGDISLQKMWNILEKYSHMNAERTLNNEEQKDTLVLSISLIPFNGELDHYIMAINPILHCLTATSPKGSVSCIRLLFGAGDIHFYNSDPIDTKSLDIEVEDEIRRRELADENRNTQREKRMEEMNRLEELRKKGYL